MDEKKSDIISEDSAKVTMNIDNEQALHVYFRNEVLKKIDLIKSFSANNKQSVLDKKALHKITQACHDIEDLAMIHGNNEIEATALQLFAHIRSLKDARPDNANESLTNINSTLQEIQTIINEPEQHSGHSLKITAQAIADKKIADNASEIQTVDIPFGKADLMPEPVAAETLFDIKEADDLLCLLEDSENSKNDKQTLRHSAGPQLITKDDLDEKLTESGENEYEAKLPEIPETLAPDEEKILETTRDTGKPKRKIKIIPSKEDVRRRWILKF